MIVMVASGTLLTLSRQDMTGRRTRATSLSLESLSVTWRYVVRTSATCSRTQSSVCYRSTPTMRRSTCSCGSGWYSLPWQVSWVFYSGCAVRWFVPTVCASLRIGCSWATECRRHRVFARPSWLASLPTTTCDRTEHCCCVWLPITLTASLRRSWSAHCGMGWKESYVDNASTPPTLSQHKRLYPDPSEFNGLKDVKGYRNEKSWDLCYYCLVLQVPLNWLQVPYHLIISVRIANVSNCDGSNDRPMCMWYAVSYTHLTLPTIYSV